jgi:hypothetical protein
VKGEALAGVLLAATTLAPTPDTGVCWEHAFRCHALTDLRGTELDQDRDLQDRAEWWAQHMATTGILEHSPPVPGGENVGVGPDWRTVYAAFMDSPPHRANILDEDWSRVGIGAHRDGDRVWIVLVFR